MPSKLYINLKLFDLGFLTVELRDLIDIVLVAFLMYRLYKLIKGSLAINIILGLVSIYMIWIASEAFQLHLFSAILNQFIKVGVIALIVIFQPEVRRFLLILGKNAGFNNRFLKQFFEGQPIFAEKSDRAFQEIAEACAFFSSEKIGALIILANTSELQFYANTGVLLDAKVSRRLLETIFEKNSPLHDGAVIVANSKIKAASCVLPVSENPDLDPKLGLRHRSALGLSEHSDALAIVVSEETGRISVAYEGKIHLIETADELMNWLKPEVSKPAAFQL